MEIYYTVEEQRLQTADGRLLPESHYVLIPYGGTIEWNIHLKQDLSKIISWRAAIGSRNSSGNPVCRITGDEINAVFQNGEWIIEFPVNTRTDRFLQTIQHGPACAAFELFGIDADGNFCCHVSFPVMLLPSIDPDGGNPLAVSDDLATVSWVKSLLLGGNVGSFVDKNTFDEKIQEITNALDGKLEQSDLSEYVDSETLETALNLINQQLSGKTDQTAFDETVESLTKLLSQKTDQTAFDEAVETLTEQIAGKTAQSVFDETVESLEQAISAVDLTDGLTISTAETTAIPIQNHAVVKYTIGEGDSFTFDVSGLSAGYCANMELWLEMRDSVKTFSFPADLTWIDNSVPSFDTADKVYAIVLRWDGSRLLANLAYSVEVV